MKRKSLIPLGVGLMLLVIGVLSYYQFSPQPVIMPGQTLTVAGTDVSITNHTSRFVQLDRAAFLRIVKEDGGGTCYSFIIDDARSEAGVVIDGIIHVTGQDEFLMNAGVVGTCYTSRFGPSHPFEAQMYDANTFGIAKVARHYGKTYEEFVALMGGITYVPQSTYNGMKPTQPLPLKFVP